MKVFFVAQYLYLHVTPFSRIIKQLIESGVSAYFVNFLNINLVKRYDEKKYNAKLFESLEIPFKELELIGDDFKQSFLLRCITYVFRRKNLRKVTLRFLQIYLSKSIIKRFLLREKPDMVVIGSDLGGVYIRIIQDLCEAFGIKVLVIITHPNLPDSKSVNYSVPEKRKKLLNKLKLEKAMYFPHRTMGSYMQESYLAVSGEAIRRNLINEHIESHRIFVTGNPVHDELYELIKEKDIGRVKQELGLNDYEKVLVYFTSLAHIKYDEAYLDHINNTIYDEFQQLEDVTLIIKFHPREDETSRLFYKNKFGTNRVVYLTDELDTTLLILLSDMLITDTGSSIVPQAILARKNSIVLNFFQERSPYKLGLDILTTNENDLRHKLKQIHPHENNSLMDDVIKDNFHLFDGKSSFRCSELIIKLLNNG